ncbi:MAG TPA: dienelactone hydrolase family protein [Kofleriaceae bacterium]|nr:dienelactone hydrolase family protein [Kofleriaceae bacterium]
MAGTRIEIATGDGVCPAVLFGDPAAPNVLMFMDGIGMRPALHAVAERIASEGFHVLLPDLYYRIGPYTAPEPAKLFADPAVRAEWGKRVSALVNSANLIADTRAFLAQLPAAKVGTTGYCMGGRLSLIAAATYPERIVAAAAYHPGNLATDTPDSPHVLAAQIKARVYVGAASDDPTLPGEQVQRLRDAFVAAHVDHTIETYPAKHGWVLDDTPVYDRAAAERHFQTLTALLRGALAG